MGMIYVIKCEITALLEIAGVTQAMHLSSGLSAHRFPSLLMDTNFL